MPSPLHIESVSDFTTFLRESPAPVIIDFTATWCGPCKSIAPVFERCANMEECKDMIFVKVDVDAGEEIATMCNISAMPTFQAYYKNELIGAFTGASVEKLENLVNTCLAKYHADNNAP